MNQSQVFFPKLEALRFPGLKALRDKMGAQSEPNLDMQIGIMGAAVTKDNFKITDKIPIVQNQKVVLYIRQPTNFAIFGTLPKYHILHCSTLKDMQKKGEYHKYYAARRMDGMFFVRLSPKDPLELRQLTLCGNCLNELRTPFDGNVFPKDPEKFPLADWLEPFFDYSSREWWKYSQNCRERTNWTCQECNINLKSKPYLLHTHHKLGTKFDGPQDLIALCIGCHAEQPGGGHRMLKYYPHYQEFMTEYGDEWRSYINSKGLDIEIVF